MITDMETNVSIDYKQGPYIFDGSVVVKGRRVERGNIFAYKDFLLNGVSAKHRIGECSFSMGVPSFTADASEEIGELQRLLSFREYISNVAAPLVEGVTAIVAKLEQELNEKGYLSIE